MDPQTQEPTPAYKEPKPKRSPWFWVLITVGGCGLLLCCISSIIGILCVTSADFQEGFTEGYCEAWEEEGADPEADPFDWCK
jgi:hypothetical protein